jgi:hypothetical protein
MFSKKEMAACVVVAPFTAPTEESYRPAGQDGFFFS